MGSEIDDLFYKTIDHEIWTELHTELPYNTTVPYNEVRYNIALFKLCATNLNIYSANYIIP